jgi:hypothetical protein
MATHHSFQKFSAKSASARIAPETPKEARLTVSLQDGDFLSVGIPRLELERLLQAPSAQ